MLNNSSLPSPLGQLIKWKKHSYLMTLSIFNNLTMTVTNIPPITSVIAKKS